jgi:mannose/fructose/N-acetylgalactosamine-specific phosphotransferase system component IIC
MKNDKTVGIAIAVAFLADYVFTFLYHQSPLMMNIYSSVPEAWRAEAEMQSYYSYGILGSLVYVCAAGLIFSHGYKGKGLIEGFKFGLLLGFVAAGFNLGSFMYLPINQAVLTGWIVGSMIEAQIIGLSLAMVYNMQAKEKAEKSAKKPKKKAAKK